MKTKIQADFGRAARTARLKVKKPKPNRALFFKNYSYGIDLDDTLLKGLSDEKLEAFVDAVLRRGAKSKEYPLGRNHTP